MTSDEGPLIDLYDLPCSFISGKWSIQVLQSDVNGKIQVASLVRRSPSIQFNLVLLPTSMTALKKINHQLYAHITRIRYTASNAP
jgi:hypothetical protein